MGNIKEKESLHCLLPMLKEALRREQVVFFTTDREKFDLVEQINVKIPLNVGDVIEGSNITAIKDVLNTGKPAFQDVHRHIFGIRLHVFVYPMFDEGEVVGTLGIGMARLHIVAKAFNIFGPIVANAFPEGAWLGITDRQKIAFACGSEKFDVPEMSVGTPIRDGDVASVTMKNNQKVVKDLKTKKYGHILFFARENSPVLQRFFPRHRWGIFNLTAS